MMRKWAALFFAFILMMTALFPYTGKAEEKKKEVVYNLIYFSEESDVVWELQEQLERLYYLNGQDFKRGELDLPTWNALVDFCADHQTEHLLRTEGNEQGVTPRLQKYILEGSPSPKQTATPEPIVITPTPAPQPSPFPVYKLHDDGSEIIGKVQDALWQLGYFDGVQGHYVSGKFDEVTEEAIRRFCDVIQVDYVQEDGITLPLYNRITAENAPMNPKPEATPFGLIYYDSRNEEIRQVQQILWDLGYFRGLSEPEWGHYDAVTSEAILQFCQVNNVPPHMNGIDANMWDSLHKEGALQNPSPLLDIAAGQEDAQVKTVQDKLFALGYYKNRQRTGICDADMLAAVADFAKANRIVFDNQSVTTAIQSAIMSENAVPYSEEAVKVGLGERISMGLTKSVSFLGLQMPLFLTILLAVVILAVLVFVVIKVFSSDSKSGSVSVKGPSGGGSAEHSMTQKPVSYNYPNGAVPRIKLDISYRGFTNSVTINMDKPLRIGRSENTLPLDQSDSDISRRHCQLYFQENTLRLRDYSTNGTIVNNQTFNNCETVVNDHDQIQVGNHQLTVYIL